MPGAMNPLCDRQTKIRTTFCQSVSAPGLRCPSALPAAKASLAQQFSRPHSNNIPSLYYSSSPNPHPTFILYTTNDAPQKQANQFARLNDHRQHLRAWAPHTQHTQQRNRYCDLPSFSPNYEPRSIVRPEEENESTVHGSRAMFFVGRSENVSSCARSKEVVMQWLRGA
jgi:hypothetical protein